MILRLQGQIQPKSATPALTNIGERGLKLHEGYVAEEHLSRLFAYCASLINDRGHHAIIVGGRPDHIHILINYNPAEKLSDLVRVIKTSTSKFITRERLSPFLPQWQTGYSCFSVSEQNTERVVKYIENQKLHHTSMSPREELAVLLQKCNIAYDEQYLFEG